MNERRVTGEGAARRRSSHGPWWWVLGWVLAGLGVLASPPLGAQERRPVARGRVIEAAPLQCPAELGVGISSGRTFCHVRTGLDPRSGAIIELPPHRGDVTLTFDLHNRHTYSEDEVRAKRGYALYTATIGVLTLEGTVLGRAVVQSEVRTAADLLDRVGGGAGGGLKAVAPVGFEPVRLTIPEAVGAVSFLGEFLEVERVDGAVTYSAAGREIALISNVMIEYRPR